MRVQCSMAYLATRPAYAAVPQATMVIRLTPSPATTQSIRSLDAVELRDLDRLRDYLTRAAYSLVNSGGPAESF